MAIRFLAAYVSMRWSGAGHIGAKQYARNRVRMVRRMRIETRGRA